MAVAQQRQPQEPQIHGGQTGQQQPAISSRTTMAENMNTTSKRQRRPSVRLVEIGDQPPAISKKQWKAINRPSKTKNLAILDVKGEKFGDEREKGDVVLDNIAIGSWKSKGFDSKRESKRPRTNWVSNKFEDEGGFSRDFEMEDSGSSFKEQNPVHDSLNNEKDLQFGVTNSEIRARIGDDVVELDGTDDDHGGQSARGLGREFDGVEDWLNKLGLGRYRSVFEIHEVDEEVLPLLTLEDLKDMGIHAVGSRRKMFCAIQKLNKEFS